MRIVFLLALTLCSVSHSFADILCARKRVSVKDGRIDLANNLRAVSQARCPSGFRLVKNLDTIKDQQIAAFAKISGNGSVLSYGGANVTGVSVDQPSPGRFDVTFSGSFRLITADDSAANRALLTVNSSAIADNYGATNNSVESASGSQITVTVFLWKSDTREDGNQAGINVSIFKGTAPLN